jgi:hypothetical protein
LSIRTATSVDPSTSSADRLTLTADLSKVGGDMPTESFDMTTQSVDLLTLCVDHQRTEWQAVETKELDRKFQPLAVGVFLAAKSARATGDENRRERQTEVGTDIALRCPRAVSGAEQPSGKAHHRTVCSARWTRRRPRSARALPNFDAKFDFDFGLEVEDEDKVRGPR